MLKASRSLLTCCSDGRAWLSGLSSKLCFPFG
jgi:hypothetical protein